MKRTSVTILIAALFTALLCGAAAAASQVELLIRSGVYMDENGRVDIESEPPFDHIVTIDVAGYGDAKTGTLKITPTKDGQITYVNDLTDERTGVQAITKGNEVTLDLFTLEYGIFSEYMTAGKKNVTNDTAYLFSNTEREQDPDPQGNMLAYSGANYTLTLAGGTPQNGTFPAYTDTETFYKNAPFPMITGGENPEDGLLSALKWGFISMSDKSGLYVFKATDREMVVDRVEIRKYDGTRILYKPGTKSQAGKTLEGEWRLPEVVAGDEISNIRVRFHFADEESPELITQREFRFIMTDGGFEYLGGLPDGTPSNITEDGNYGVAPEDFAKMSGYSVNDLDVQYDGMYWLSGDVALEKAKTIDESITAAYCHAIYGCMLEAGKDTKAESYVLPGWYFQYDGKLVTDPKDLIVINAPKKNAPAQRFVYEQTPANFADGKFTVVDPATNLPVDTMKYRGRYRMIVFIKDNGAGDSDPTAGSVADATITVSRKGGVVIDKDKVKAESLPSGVSDVNCVSTGDPTPSEIADIALDPTKIADVIEGGESIAAIEPLDTITLDVEHDGSLGADDRTELTILIEGFDLGDRELKQNEELVFLLKRSKDDDPSKGKWVAHVSQLADKTLKITIKGVGAFFTEAKGTVCVKTSAGGSGGSSGSCAAGAAVFVALAALAVMKSRKK